MNEELNIPLSLTDPSLDDFTDICQLELKTVSAKLHSSRQYSEILQAGVNHQFRLDDIFRQGVTNCPGGIACRRGCFFCCHMKVDAAPWEIFSLVDYARRNLTPKQLTVVQTCARSNRDAIRIMTVTQQIAANMQCPFLMDNQCVAYHARPNTCRMYHSRSVTTCERAFTHPNDENNLENPIPSLRLILAGMWCARDQAFAEAGYDTRPYDLSSALIEAFENPKCVKRWRDGKRAFSKLCLAKDWDEEEA